MNSPLQDLLEALDAWSKYPGAHYYYENLQTAYRAYKAAPKPLVLEDTHPEQMAKVFHETYENLANEFGYETRKQSAVPWDKVPDKNKQLMIATCKQVIAHYRLTEDKT